MKGVYSVAFSSFHNLLSSLLYLRLATIHNVSTRTKHFCSIFFIAGCMPVASMSESPRHPNPGLNGYQQDVMHAEVGTHSIPSHYNHLQFRLFRGTEPEYSAFISSSGAFLVFNAKA
jgi:hypothetical protein